MKLEFRKLYADEIECRVGSINQSGVSLLLYKDARVDQGILDETVGALNWSKSYSRDNANCIVSIWDEDKRMWIPKEDTGTENFMEKEKSIASDSFKRACFCWGIGRELYTSPDIWVSKEDCSIYQDPKGKWHCKDSFYVEGINYDERGNIAVLAIRNQSTGKRVFSMNNLGKK